MAWVKLEDSVVEHRKHLQAGPAACWLWVCGIAYCQRQLTDGFIPVEAVGLLGVAKGVKSLLATLVRVRLFDSVDGGYQVHDYLAHNSTRQEALKRREDQHTAKVRAGIAGSRARWQADSRPIADADSRPIAPSHPIPSHPKKNKDTDALFERWWAVYPRKEAKAVALKSWQKLHPTSEFTTQLVDAVTRQCLSAQWQKEGGSFIPFPATWLNQARWQDEKPASSWLADVKDWSCHHDPPCEAGTSAHKCHQRTILEAGRKQASG